MELNLGLAILVSFRKSISPDSSMSGPHKMKKRCNCLKQHNISMEKKGISHGYWLKPSAMKSDCMNLCVLK